MKKITLVFCVVILIMQLCPYRLNAQKLWGIQNGSVFNMNADGTAYSQSLPSLIGDGKGLISGADGMMYGLNSHEGTETLYSFDPETKQLGHVAILPYLFNSFDLVVESPGVFYVVGEREDVQVNVPGIFYYEILKINGNQVELVYSNQQLKLLSLLDGNDGKFYINATNAGGGAVLQINKDGTNSNILHSFVAGEGVNPETKLVLLTGGELLGATSSGGLNGGGTLYRMQKDGSLFTVTHHFQEGNGIHNHFGKSLYSKSGYIYGIFGALDLNLPYNVSLFRVNLIGTDFTAIQSPSGTPKSELSNIVEHNDRLYLMNLHPLYSVMEHVPFGNSTSTGGLIEHTSLTGPIAVSTDGKLYGTFVRTSPEFTTGVFSLSPPFFNGLPIFNIEATFKDLGVGTNAFHIVQGKDNAVYGLTSDGGANDSGTLFSIDSEGVHRVRDLYYAENLGTNIIDGGDGNIYGVALQPGGPAGTIYRVKKDGTDFQEKYVTAHFFRSVTGLVHTRENEIIALTEGRVQSPSMGYLFKFKPNLAGIQTIFNFSREKGYVPLGDLIQADDGFLYSTTSLGGLYRNGVIFKVLPDGTGYVKIHEFSGVDGRYPEGGVVEDDNGNLYGATTEGGAHNQGVIYKIKKDGTDFTIIFEFDGTIASKPYGSLVLHENYLFGATGKDSNNSLAFRINTDGTEFTPVLRGGNPRLFFSQQPEMADVYIINPPDSATKLREYGIYEANVIPKASSYVLEISLSPSFETLEFWGTGQGPEFYVAGLQRGKQHYARVKTNLWPEYGKTTTVTTAADFVPRLWGVTTTGGSNPCVYDLGGTVFSMALDGTDFVKHLDYDCATDTSATFSGKQLMGSPMLSDNDKIYALGVNVEYRDPLDYYNIKSDGNAGEILRFNYDGTGPEIVYDSLDIHAYGRLTLGFDNNFYLIDPEAFSDIGAFRRFESDGSTTVPSSYLHRFSYRDDGRQPKGALYEHVDGYLYGTTNHGGATVGRGTIYKVRPDGSDFTKIHDFDRGNPKGGVLASRDGRNYLYGMTFYGYGSVYQIKNDGTDFRVLHEFTANKNTSGRHPYGDLIELGYTLYGMTSGGGQFNNAGTIFRIDKDGSNFKILHHFNGINGATPLGSLTFDYNKLVLYGMTSAGGNNNLGVVFSIKRDGTEFTKLYDFSLNSGGKPDGNLILVDSPVGIEEKSSHAGFRESVISLENEQLEEEKSVKVYPNPTTNSFNIELTDRNMNGSSLVITDVQGRALHQRQLFFGQHETFGEDLAQGFYILTVAHPKKTVIVRVVKK